ncbi:hypothetical protein FQZ97_1078750 [compost metagenome]
MRLLKFGKLALAQVPAAALQRIVLRLQRLGHFVLVAGLMRPGLPRRIAQALVLLAPAGQPRHRLAHVRDMRLRVGPRFGAHQQSLG